MGLFESAEAWDVADEQLPIGTHRVNVKDPAMKPSSRGTSQIELRVSGSQGGLRDWVTCTERSIGKVVQLYDACKAKRPSEGEYTVDPDGNIELSDDALARLNNAECGVVVREEASWNDPTRMIRRVAGYITADRVSDELGADTSDLPSPGYEQDSFAGTASTRHAGEDDIPF